jgi:hypothetical protein
MVAFTSTVLALKSTSRHRSASTAPMRAPVASISSMMSARSSELFGPGRSLAIHSRTPERAVSRSLRVKVRASVLGRLTLIDPRTGFEAKVPASMAVLSIAPVTTFALRCRFTLCVPSSDRTALMPSVVNSPSRSPPSVGTTSLRSTRSYSLIVVFSSRPQARSSCSQLSTNSATVVLAVMGQVIVRSFSDVGRVALRQEGVRL